MRASSLLWLAQAAIEIAGGGGCPDPAAVSRNLASLLPAVPEAGLSGSGASQADPSAAPSVQLSRTSTGALDILLLGPDGRWLDEKRLEGASACEDLAVAAAVIIATWVLEPEPSLPERVDLPRVAASTSRREASLTGPSITGRPSLAGAAARRSPSTRLLRLGAVAAATADQWAPGLRLEGGVVLWGGRWGLGAAVAATMPRSASVGWVSDAARWTRQYLGVGPEVALLPGPIELRAHLHGLLGLLHLTGNGLDMSASETGLRFGGAAGLWAAWRRWNGIWPWIGADVLFWPGREYLRVDGVSPDGRVPALDAQLAAGLGIDLFP